MILEHLFIVLILLEALGLTIVLKLGHIELLASHSVVSSLFEILDASDHDLKFFDLLTLWHFGQ